MVQELFTFCGIQKVNMIVLPWCVSHSELVVTNSMQNLYECGKIFGRSETKNDRSRDLCYLIPLKMTNPFQSTLSIKYYFSMIYMKTTLFQ